MSPRFDNPTVIAAKELLEKVCQKKYRWCYICKGLLPENTFYKNTFSCKPCEKTRRKNDPKTKIRAKTQVLVRKGEINKTPCVGCGSEEVEAHHLSYDDPTNVEFRCRPCHQAVHRKIDQNN